MADTKLDLLFPDSHSCYQMMLADISQYADGFKIVSPTIQITLPFGGYVTLPFTAKNVNIFNSTSLKITCDNTQISPLPDGIYRFKYTVNPSATYFVEKTIIRVDLIEEQLANAWLKLDLDCNSDPEDKEAIDDIERLVGQSVAAANSCAEDLSIKLYRLASKELSRFNKNQTCCKL